MDAPFSWDCNPPKNAQKKKKKQEGEEEEEEEDVEAVFIDIEKAYDMLWREGLLIILYEAGVRGRLFNWIKDILRNRTMQVRVGRMLPEELKVENGIPQGSVMSPVLFNILINGIFGTVRKDLGLSLFADDGAIWK